MKNKILRKATIGLAVVLLLGLFGACSTTTSSTASRRPLTASRDSSGPARNPDIIEGGTRIPAQTSSTCPPSGDTGPREENYRRRNGSTKTAELRQRRNAPLTTPTDLTR